MTSSGRDIFRDFTKCDDLAPRPPPLPNNGPKRRPAHGPGALEMMKKSGFAVLNTLEMTKNGATKFVPGNALLRETLSKFIISNAEGPENTKIYRKKRRF